MPRSLASAFAPLLAGMMLDYSLFGWPLVFAGGLKALYDVLLLNPVPLAASARRAAGLIAPSRRAISDRPRHIVWELLFCFNKLYDAALAAATPGC